MLPVAAQSQVTVNGVEAVAVATAPENTATPVSMTPSKTSVVPVQVAATPATVTDEMVRTLPDIAVQMPTIT
jgi:hypothetical protein